MFYKPDLVLPRMVKPSRVKVAARTQRLPPKKLAPVNTDGGGRHFQTKRRWFLWAFSLAGIVLLAIFIAAFFATSLWPAAPLAHEIQYAGNARLAFSKEALIPPPPLPPSIFIGTQRANLETADRDWDKLEPGFRQKLLEIFARMAARGYPLALVEGYRSPDRQDQLAEAEQKLTNARAFHSMHQFGLAADVAPIRNGRLAFDLADEWTKAAYFAFGEEAMANKLIWGGTWALQDYGHVQLIKTK